MDLVPPGFDIESRLAALQSEQQHAPGELGREAFLELLIGQLTNQDPLSPMQDHEFVAQLATFSSLEQLESINDGMQASLLMNQSVNNSLATNLIGKEVLVAGDSVKLPAEGDVSFQVQLAQDASVTIRITDESGQVVREIQKGSLSDGSNDVAWDGKTSEGVRAEAGEYNVEIVATDANGVDVAAQLRVRARVDGVRFHEGSGFLLVNGEEVALSSIVEVLAASDG
jgi:flagellar basal-body rod modification protein FlgD